MSSQADNVYPRHGSHFLPTTPQDQQEDNEKVKNEVFTNIELLNEVMLNLQAQIDHYKSIDALRNQVGDDPEKFMHTVEAAKIVVTVLETELSGLKEVIEAHTER